MENTVSMQATTSSPDTAFCAFDTGLFHIKMRELFWGGSSSSSTDTQKWPWIRKYIYISRRWVGKKYLGYK